MKKVMFFVIILCGWWIDLYGQGADSALHHSFEGVVVSSTRQKERSSVPHTTLNHEQISKHQSANQLPALLEQLPSVVIYTEGGTPVGNSFFRIRGTAPNRINVTLNGMPLNNPESQEVYWINLPNLTSSLRSIQLQRGVGSVGAGTASFGASLSLETKSVDAKPFGEAQFGMGSYGAFSSTISAGTGLLRNGLSVEARYSRTLADGYIRNGKVDHTGAHIALSHYIGDKQMIRLSYLNGIQHSGITWLGVTPEQLAVDRRYNEAGAYHDQANNLLYYNNETDNYYSDIVQIYYNRRVSKGLTLNLSAGWNGGFGYYENYLEDADLVEEYRLPPQNIAGVQHTISDVIRRKLMRNDLYSVALYVEYSGKKLSISSGISTLHYDGDHYGALRWVEYNENITADYSWSKNRAKKSELSGWVRMNYNPIERLSLFAEVGYRHVDYRLKGIDDDFEDITQKNIYDFFAPSIGLAYNFDSGHALSINFATSSREPLRSDLKEAVKGGAKSKLKPEKLYDTELGYRYSNKQLELGVSLYYMRYKEQFTQTGKLSDIGYKFQENVPDSYRIGVEIQASWSATRWLRLSGNLTLSQNKIKNYMAYYSLHDPQSWQVSLAPQQIQHYGTTDISFSPQVVGGASATFTPIDHLQLTLSGRYVGSMYSDSKQEQESKLDRYFVSNLELNYKFTHFGVGWIGIGGGVYNLFNAKYVANGWSEEYRFTDGSRKIIKGLYPQAPINYMINLSIGF